MDSIARRDQRILALQRRVSFLFFPIVAPTALFWARVIKRLSVRDADTVRARFAKLVEAEPGPILICSNHLTLVDTVILVLALAPLHSYLSHYSRFPWSVPEKSNFSTWFWRVASFLGKCVYVTRGGPREEVKRTLAKITYLLRSGELVSIFPEGGRSRTARVDTENFTYGVGQIVQAVPETRVLCVYMRGRKQEGYTDYPHTGDVYSLELEMLRPTTTATGLRGARDLATQIIRKLAEMETRYFDRERSGRPASA
ncbi:MAG TPA: 1-acyl-sn-glycerol-3-phosphate acyltransferase [Gemmatimonadaceae bacterium]